MFIDTHCHLDFEIFDDSRDDIVEECKSLNINKFINPATSFSNWQELIHLREKFSNISICFGLHPIFIEKHSQVHIEQLKKYTIENNCKLIGEIGLDKRFNNFDKQIDIFSQQLNIAKELNKKVIIHSVKTHNEIIKIIKDTSFTNGGIIHAFNGTYQEAKIFINLGFKLGIGGILSHTTSKLKETLNKVSYKDIVLETDSPDMNLYDSKESINKPQNIIKIFDLLKNIYMEDPDILEQQIYKNSLELT
ncbi:TatD family hydrolase [Francisella frigiditurris]|uniref:TatD related DNase family protein n=1 Tax=Francisella frigiditurris TaxID=1542390 RepID=A0A1J0KRW9_9GAMM|nr:TatD family hydrolase [Francisella frigiditurris]APC96398.1 tatD related DNase family protein [Francisella frigiditurris]